MRFRVLEARSAEGVAAWEGLWRRWPLRDAMAHPRYAALFARPCDRAVCAVGEGEGGAILFPLILRPLSAEPWAGPAEPAWDAVSPYGYGGPYALGPGGCDAAAYWRAFEEWCARERIVSTFIRLTLFGEELAPLPVPADEVARNVVIRLDGGRAGLERGYDRKVFRWVETAERAGLEVEVDLTGRRLDEFMAVYADTMRRHDAEDFYWFPRDLFEGVVSGMPGRFAFVHAVAAGRVVSSDLLLLSARHACFFLGGTLLDFLPFGASYLVKHRSALWAIEQGLEALVLGGGHPRSEGLLRFKRAFARRGEVPFRVARLVHDERACAELLARRAAHEAAHGRPWTPRPGFFPAYRA